MHRPGDVHSCETLPGVYGFPGLLFLNGRGQLGAPILTLMLRLMTFETPEDVARGLRSAGYATDPVLVQIIWLATRMQKPILVEGPPEGADLA